MHSDFGRDLSFDEFDAWTRRQLDWIAEKSHADARGELFLYTQAAKLVEEIGELHAELLGRSSLQRSDKGQNFDGDTLGAEFADVVICAAILAHVAGIDLRAALRAKMDAVDRRVATGRTEAPA